MFKRIQNLWRLSGIELPNQADEKTFKEKFKEIVLGKKKAVIIETDKPDLFEEHHEAP